MNLENLAPTWKASLAPEFCGRRPSLSSERTKGLKEFWQQIETTLKTFQIHIHNSQN